jgi:hypothetical protein
MTLIKHWAWKILNPEEGTMCIYKNIRAEIQIAVFCFLMTVLAGCTTTSDTENLSLEELRGIRSSLEKIADHLAEQNAYYKKLAAFSSKYVSSSAANNVNVEKLADIGLPKNPGEEDVKKYINAIKIASAGQRGMSSRDPQVGVLKAVGRENVPLLIDALLKGAQEYPFRYHAIYAIQGLADESHKALILESLAKEQRLAGIVLEKGWANDAHDTLVEGFKKGHRLEMDWIKAVASLNDPDTYPLLRDYFINEENSYWVYDTIKDLPIEDLDGAVAQAWQNSQYSHEYSRQKMAMIATEYGHIDALEYLIETLEFPSSTTQSHVLFDIRLAVVKATGLSEGNEKLAEWFNSNRDHLKFNPDSQKFVIEQESEQKN